MKIGTADQAYIIGSCWPTARGSCWPTGRGSCWPTARGSYWPTGRGSCWPTGRGSCWPTGRGSCWPTARGSFKKVYCFIRSSGLRPRDSAGETTVSMPTTLRPHLQAKQLSPCVRRAYNNIITRQMLSIVGERERTHLVLQYVTMCIHVDWCLASFLSFLSSIVIMDMSQSLSI